jgi:hypothetical protein
MSKKPKLLLIYHCQKLSVFIQYLQQYGVFSLTSVTASISQTTVSLRVTVFVIVYTLYCDYKRTQP